MKNDDLYLRSILESSRGLNSNKDAILLGKRVLLLRMQFDSATTDTLRSNDYDSDNNSYDSVTINTTCNNSILKIFKYQVMVLVK